LTKELQEVAHSERVGPQIASRYLFRRGKSGQSGKFSHDALDYRNGCIFFHGEMLSPSPPARATKAKNLANRRMIADFLCESHRVLGVPGHPATPVGIVKGFALWISPLVIQIALLPIPISFIRHTEAPMRYMDQETLHLPHVPLRQAPVVVAKIGQIADGVSHNASREVDIGLGVTVHELPEGSKNRLSAVQAGIARARHSPPFAVFSIKKKNVIEVVLRLKIEQQGRITMLLQDHGSGQRGLQAVG
jgi:hypothetical protein